MHEYEPKESTVQVGRRQTVPTIERPRLDEPLELLLCGERRIVTVWAAAGSGKTTLLQQWAHRLECDGLNVVRADSGEFFRRSAAVVGAAGQADAGGEPERQFVLLDDAHKLSTAQARNEMLLFMQALPPRVSLVVAGRFQPTPSLAFLQAAGILTELRMADLSFDDAEIGALVDQCGYTMEDDVIRLLARRTGGWAVALVLAMPWLRDSLDVRQSVSRFTGDQRSVADFLVNRVLGSLSAVEQTALTKSALRRIVPEALAVKLTGMPNACELLDQIAERVSLLTVDVDGYHFHPVLLSFLQAGSRRQDLRAVADAHAVASRWHQDRAEAAQAVTEAVLSLQPSAIESAVESFGLELMLAGDSALMLRAAAALPSQGAPLPLIATNLLLELPDFVDTLHVSYLFDMALRDVHVIRPTRNRWLAVIYALHCFQHNSTSALVDRLDRLGMPDIAALRSESLALNLLSTTAEAWCMGELGDTENAQRMLDDVGISALRAGFTWLYLLKTELATRIATQNGAWETARVLEDEVSAELRAHGERASDRVRAVATIMDAERSLRRCEPVTTDGLDEIIAADPRGPMIGLTVRAQALRQFPELDSATNPRPAFEALDHMIVEYGLQSPRLFAPVSVQMVSLGRTLDGRQRAIELAERFAFMLGTDCLESKTIRFALKMPVRVGDPAEGDLIAATAPQARPWYSGTPVAGWYSGAPVTAWLLLARSAEQQGRHDEATSRLMEALRIAHRVDTIQPFAVCGGDGVDLLGSRMGRFGPLDDFAVDVLQRVLRLLPVRPGGGASGFLLTAREHDILNELPLYQSVGEIAQRKSLSVNTVKSHLRNIYQKLGVSGRSAAVVEAHNRGLL